MSQTPLYRAAADLVHKHSRVSTVAAAAAAAGVLGAAGFAAGAAPWAQAIDNVGQSMQGGSHATQGQASGSIIDALTGANSGKATAGANLDAIRSGATSGGTGSKGVIPAVDAQSGKQQANATDTAVTKHAQQQPAKQAQPAVAKKQPAKKQAVKAQPAKAHATKPKAAAPAKPFLIYDSVTPGNIPNGEAAAVYANGAYAASATQTSGHRSVLWIDVNGSNPKADVLDVEPGDATPAGAAQWVQQRLSAQPTKVAIVYTMMSDWQQVKDHVAHLPGWMQSKVRYWIADPTGVPHVVPGASATQWYWGSHYDITTANPDFVR